jgi:hypothetical protein
LPTETVHVHVLPTGKVLFWPYSDDARLLDPATNEITLASLAGYNLFCAGHATLADGRLLVIGGHEANDVGLPFASVYDPFTNKWTQLPNMNAGRWYPTATTLANGDVLAISGSLDLVVGENNLPQVYEHSQNRWRDLVNARLTVGLYPFMHLAPDGRVFMSGGFGRSMLLNTSGAGTWTDVAYNTVRDYGSSVMYDVGKVLVVGGGDPPLATAAVIDLNAATPSWRAVQSMSIARRQLDATILADGTVFVSGGTYGPGFANDTTPVYTSQIWNPATETWTTTASAARHRIYHSAAVLLPDGRVFTSGGQGEETAEYFSPPYLFRGARPTITSAPDTVAHGQQFFVATPNATSITKVHLIKLSSVTHAFNQDQRINRLQFSQGSGGLNVTAPANGNVGPPGYYMLFIVDGTGVPSVAKIVRLGPPGPAPAAPTGLAATAASGLVSLVWSNVSGASAYKVYRSTTSGSYNFASPLATVPSPSYVDSAVTNGTTYYYTVRATNGSDSPSSNEASATPTGSSLRGTATFVRADTTTQGNWMSKYGSDGQVIASEIASLPAYAQVSVTGAETYVWEPTTLDARALQRPGNQTERIASQLYSLTHFTFDVRLGDGQPHWIALYCLDYDFAGREQTVDVIEAATGARLDSRILTNFSGGVYLVWQVTGHVQVRVAKELYIGPNATASGLFLGPPSDLPSVTLTSPANGSSFAAPANITVNATATTPTGSISKVEFFQGSTKLGEDLTSPYSFAWSNVSAGAYVVTAKATTNGGATGVSAPAQVLVASGTAGASFVRSDSTTQGNWRTAYGAEGYGIVGDASSYPPYAQVVTTGNVSYVWDTAPTDVRALQRAVGSGRVAATWVADTTFDIDVNVTDGQVHQVAIYCMDWDSTERVQRIDVLNAVTGAVLDTRTISAFSAGRYLVWNVSGGVTIRVTRVGPYNAIVEGIFFGGVNSTTATLTSPSNGAAYLAPANVAMSATASTTSGTITKVEFFQGSTKLGEDLTSPYSLTWPSVPAGTYTLTAKATNSAAGTATSDPVQIVVAGGSAAASFVRADTTTKGNWRGTYGSDGFSVVGDTTSYPAYAQVVPSGHFTWVWETATSDVRALQRSVGSGRVAAAWNASTPFNIGVNVTDGLFHQLAIYCVDWDSTERVQRVDVLNAVTGAVLDTRTIGGFNGGQWLVWNVTGGITLRVTTVAGVNGVIQGIFFGGAGNAAPAVTLTGPASGASFTAPATVPLTATATDTDGTVTLVEFFQGTTKLGQDTTAPYSYAWTGVTAGPYNLTARATDNSGGLTTSAVVPITVNPPANVPPTASITAPANGATFTAPASVTINATAGDTDGTVTLVEFFQGTTKLGQDTTAPYSYAWTGVTAGSYNLTARATDNSGATTTSAGVNVTVAALATPAAPSQLDGNALSRRRIRLTWQDNSTNESGFRIERSLNGTTFTEIDTRAANAESYTDNNLSSNTLYYYRVRAYNSAGNSAYTSVISVRSR